MKKRKISNTQLIDAYSMGLNDVEIAEQYNCATSTIFKRRVNLFLIANFHPKLIKKDDFIKSRNKRKGYNGEYNKKYKQTDKCKESNRKYYNSNKGKKTTKEYRVVNRDKILRKKRELRLKKRLNKGG